MVDYIRNTLQMNKVDERDFRVIAESLPNLLHVRIFVLTFVRLDFEVHLGI